MTNLQLQRLITETDACSRRQFLINSAQGTLMATLSLYGLSSLASCKSGASDNATREAASAEQRRKGKLGIALAGLGKYAGDQLAPALNETEHCYLSGIVTGTPDKIDKWKRKHDIPDKNVYSYENFDSIRDNPDIDVVYVVLPNAMHAEYVIRAAQAGKHVICEKPMAVTVEDCDRMIAACKEAGKMLSIGYRLHFEPYNKEMMRIGQQQVFGKVLNVRAEDGMNGTEGWRLDKALAGGGPVMDVGIYCVQAARYTTGLEPIAVRAQEGKKTEGDTFRNIEQSMTFQLEFPGNVIAECRCSYADELNVLRIDAERGWAELSPAYAYSGQKGKTSNGGMDFPHIKQQAAQMDDFALAIKQSRPTPVPGEMGRQDVKILQAIYQAARTGQRVEIGA